MATSRPTFPAAQARWQTVEGRRLQDEAAAAGRLWQAWGPYPSERQWGTVREDYSAEGSAWSYFPHDHARSRAYRWGEDGLAGWSDDQGLLCLSLALWNGQDPILKERLFGLTNEEGNHGEDVKEVYYYVDATPSHAYLRFLYKYPASSFPYEELVHRNRERDTADDEFELVDTGAFDADDYFDIQVEYAQRRPGDLCAVITATNRSSEPRPLWLVPQITLRDTWSWNDGSERPRLTRADDNCIEVDHPELGRLYWCGPQDASPIFCENETNFERLYGTPNATPYPKDALHRYLVDGDSDAVNPNAHGTKAAFWRRFELNSGEVVTWEFRIAPTAGKRPLRGVASTVDTRRSEADEYYRTLQEDISDPECRRVQRQALAGMIWSKQFYYYDVKEWLAGDPANPVPPSERRSGRNAGWAHLNNADILSMPDKWEYPWYAAWDLAFHCIPFALIDPAFAKEQLVLLTREWYLHPNGQLPAYEWALEDVNPPVHAWAALRVFQIDRRQRGDDGDLDFLERVFHKLMLNFTWWVNRKDAAGNNVFEGGFLGLDNIGIFDRSAPLPMGGSLSQADGTSWMAMYSLNLMRIALELAPHRPPYEDIATKFFEHFLHIAEAINDFEGTGLWDVDDEFYYDFLICGDGARVPLRVRSMVGLLPLCAVETLEPSTLRRLPKFAERLRWVLTHRPALAAQVSDMTLPGSGKRRLLSLVDAEKLRGILAPMLDEGEFLSPYGLRALSKCHKENPFVFSLGGEEFGVTYEPGESRSGVFGGNSNWRGPIWFPVNFLLIESLQKLHHYYGPRFRVECPTGSGRMRTLGQVAEELRTRLVRIFLPDESGVRPVLRRHPKFSTDPHFRDWLLFHEYFHGDDGAGVGASHQTGWTGLVAKLLHPPVKEG